MEGSLLGRRTCLENKGTALVALGFESSAFRMNDRGYMVFTCNRETGEVETLLGTQTVEAREESWHDTEYSELVTEIVKFPKHFFKGSSFKCEVWKSKKSGIRDMVIMPIGIPSEELKAARAAEKAAEEEAIDTAL